MIIYPSRGKLAEKITTLRKALIDSCLDWEAGRKTGGLIESCPLYEVWNMGERRGRLEIGLHFESRDRVKNLTLLAGFSRRMVAVKATLGPQWEAEPWDRGWTKVYETVPYEPFSTEVLDAIARRLARAMTVLQPIWDAL